MNRYIKTTLIAALLSVGSLIAAADISWPVESDWNALYISGGYYHDVLSDQSPSALDLIGDANSYSAGFWALVENGSVLGGVTNDAFMFRMRVGAQSGNYVWQAHLNTDLNLNDVEYIFQLVQSGNPADQGVELIQVANGGPTLGDISVANKTDPNWLGDLNMYSRWTQVSGSSDYYVDIAMPWSDFKSITGVTALEQVNAVLATSSTHAGINKDAPLGSDLSLQVSSALSASIPEPAVATLLIGAGSGMIFFRRIFKRREEEDAS